MTAAASLWRRLDAPGHDACRLEENAGGWVLDGTAVFLSDEGPSRLSYEVECDRSWSTRRGRVHGWLGPRPVQLRVVRGDEYEGWSLNGRHIIGLETCVDLDLAFTPATNLLPVRRLALAVGHSAEAPAASLDPTTGVLTILPQRYQRRTRETYWYEAPRVPYAGLLSVAPTGFVRVYPGLWEAEPERRQAEQFTTEDDRPV